jgi:WD40 repeat protein
MFSSSTLVSFNYSSQQHCKYLSLFHATGDVIIWDFVLRSTARVITAHAGAVTYVAWSRRSRALLTASLDGHVHLWDLSGVSTDALAADRTAADNAKAAATAAQTEHSTAGSAAVNTAITAHSSDVMPAESSSTADTSTAPSSSTNDSTTSTHVNNDATIATDSSTTAATATTAGVTAAATDGNSSSSTSSSKPHLQASPKLQLKVCFSGIGVVTAALHPFAVPLAAAVLTDGSCWLINTETVSNHSTLSSTTHKQHWRC